MKLKFLFPLFLLASCVQKNTAIAYLKGIGSNPFMDMQNLLKPMTLLSLLLI
ncbi:MAG: hypothetical protein Ct9H90mP20_1360 [Candidatus Neomarinimicrobiota bacterium]|nr:MAG: hypothetical protein Ct9H90mP20_1360 [Candidatus Neomarinimicrobiota bacterium]